MLAGSRPQPHSATAVFDSQARLNVAAVRSAKYYLSPARQDSRDRPSRLLRHQAAGDQRMGQAVGPTRFIETDRPVSTNPLSSTSTTRLSHSVFGAAQNITKPACCQRFRSRAAAQSSHLRCDHSTVKPVKTAVVSAMIEVIIVTPH